MANQLNRNKISSIENKICEFKVGVDYNFEGEKYHAPDQNMRGHTTRSYKIISPQLQKVVQKYLSQQIAIFMQFEFESQVYNSERIRPDNVGQDWEEKYHAIVDDENGNCLNYGRYGRPEEGGGFNLLITCLDEPRKSKEDFNQHYQAVKKIWEAKGSPIQNTPPSGTKCWNCYEVIADEDIATGRYRVENSHYGPTSQEKKLSYYKTFEHVKGVCEPLAYDCALRNNYRYHSELIDKWLKTYPQKKHEISCQDCLNRLWNEVNSNLIYLETWAPEQKGKIGSHQQVLAEIKARLGRLEKTGEYHNCGIKKCCAEHDKNENHHHGNNELIKANKNLMAGSDFSSIPNNKQINKEEKKTIREYFETKKIFSITLDEDKLVIVYNDKSQEIVEVNNSQLRQIKKMVENQPNQRLSFSELQENAVNSSPDNNKLYQGLAIGVLGGVILVGVASIFIVRKKLSSKKN